MAKKTALTVNMSRGSIFFEDAKSVFDKINVSYKQQHKKNRADFLKRQLTEYARMKMTTLCWSAGNL